MIVFCDNQQRTAIGRYLHYVFKSSPSNIETHATSISDRSLSRETSKKNKEINRLINCTFNTDVLTARLPTCQFNSYRPGDSTYEALAPRRPRSIHKIQIKTIYRREYRGVGGGAPARVRGRRVRCAGWRACACVRRARGPIGCVQRGGVRTSGGRRRRRRLMLAGLGAGAARAARR